jgi:hypothetical protein
MASSGLGLGLACLDLDLDLDRHHNKYRTVQKASSHARKRHF